MKIKTSTRISLIFSVFTFFIILSLLGVLHVYLFFSWYNKEIEELRDTNQLSDIISDTYKQILDDELSEGEEKEIFSIKSLFDVEENDIHEYEKLFLNLYRKGDTVFLIYERRPGVFYAPYDVSEYYNEQARAVELGLILLIIFTLLSFLLAKVLFIKLALRDIHSITKKLKKIHLHNLKRIDLPLHKDDEIHTIVEGINHFLDVIEENTKNLEAFNTQIAHEFKTPLMVISSELEYLELKGKKNESSKRVEYQIQKLDRLLEHFLLLTKIQNGKKITKENVSLKEVIQENLEVLEKKYIEKEILLHLQIKKDYTIYTNKDFLHIILKNILDNAFKYNTQGGEIHLVLKNNRLKISDTGTGIDSENLDKIWNNLYRENEFQDGYGVGLNLVKKLIQILGYKIEAKSSKGKGSEFIIYFS